VLSAANMGGGLSLWHWRLSLSPILAGGTVLTTHMLRCGQYAPDLQACHIRGPIAVRCMVAASQRLCGGAPVQAAAPPCMGALCMLGRRQGACAEGPFESVLFLHRYTGILQAGVLHRTGCSRCHADCAAHPRVAPSGCTTVLADVSAD
jgi:hypothetical protein